MRPALSAAISFFVLALVGAGVGAWWVLRPVPAYAQGPGRFYVVQSSFRFSPSVMTWHVGEHVSLTIVNHDQARPPRIHMWGVGRGLRMKHTVLQGDVEQLRGDAYVAGTLPADAAHETLIGGFKHDLFKGMTIRVSHAHGVFLLFHPHEKVTGPSVPAKFVQKQDVGPPIFAVQLLGGGAITFDFTVPDRPGLWGYGCFQQDSQHYLNGMRGQIEIVR